MRGVWLCAGLAVVLGGCTSASTGAEGSPRISEFETAPVDDRLAAELADPLTVVDTEQGRPGRRDDRALRERPRRYACRIDEYAIYLNRPLSAAQSSGLPINHRVFAVGEEPPADDYQPDRLNLFLDRSGEVFRMTCQ